MTNLKESELRIRLDAADFRDLVGGREVATTGQNFDGKRRVRIILSDIGFDVMQEALDAAMAPPRRRT